MRTKQTNIFWRYFALCACCLLLSHLSFAAESNRESISAQSAGYGPAQWPQALHMADFILSLQNAGGAIPDERGVITVNQDSNMEYALMGIGAAYAATKNVKYLDGLEKGIQWLAAREDMSDTKWKGSWYYVYSANPPYAHIPTSPGAGLVDARGVDATSALFPYLLYLDQRLTGNSTLAQEYAANARAALDFIVNHNLDSDGLSRSSWQLHADDGQWHFFQEKYSADQGDVYLGMHAGEVLYHDARYGRVADKLREQTTARIFRASLQRYDLGMDQNGGLDSSDDGNSADFSQGYLSWTWGDNKQSRAALNWLRSQVRQDGSVVSKADAPKYGLNVAMLSMSDRALAQPAPLESLRWFIENSYNPSTGGVYHDLGAGKKHEYNNDAGFCVMGFLGFLPFE